MVTQETWQAIRDTDHAIIGKQTSLGLASDPKRLAFVLARYKFILKMGQGFSNALEIGCGDGFGTTLTASVFDRVLAIDIEKSTLESRSRNPILESKVDFRRHDILAAPVDGVFDVAYSLDVLEHIPLEREGLFFTNICLSMAPRSMCIIGTPNKSAEAHQSIYSARDHINLKTYDDLRLSLQPYFDYVLMFGMNDEVLHTGFGPMCHYLFAVGLGPKMLAEAGDVQDLNILR